MPALPDVPNVVRVQVLGTSSELSWANVMHWQYTGAPPNSASVNDFAAAFLTAFAGNVASLMDTATTIEECIVTDLSSPSSNVGHSSAATAGTNGGGILPANVAVLITYPIALRYRGGHPRQYLFVGTSGELEDQSTWTTAFITSVSDAWAAVIASVTGHTFDGTAYTGQCAVSYRTAGAPRVTPVVLPFISGDFTAETRCASQRRRMRRRT